MPSHAPGADPGLERACPQGHRLDYDYTSLNHHLASPTYADYEHTSDVNYDPVLNNDHTNTLALPNPSHGVHSGFSSAAITASLHLQLDGSDLSNPPNSFDNPPAPGNVYYARTLLSGILPTPCATPVNVNNSRGFGEAVDEDDIAAERILTGTSTLPHSRVSPGQIPIFDASQRTPAPAPTKPAANRRAFIPLPNFDIAPTVELPPSADSSLDASRGEDLGRGTGGVLSGVGTSVLYPQASPTGHVSSSSNRDQVIRVSPCNVYHPRPTPWSVSDWVGPSSATVDYNRSVVSGSGSLYFEASTSHALAHANPFPVASTPSWAYTEASFSFGYDDSYIQAVGSTSFEQYFTSATDPLEPSSALQYPFEEPAPGFAIPDSISPRSIVGFPFSYNHVRTGTLPPHPPGYLPQRGQNTWLQHMPGFNTLLPLNDGRSYYHGADPGAAEYAPASYSIEDSFAGFYTESSASHTEIVGNRREESPFGPAIQPVPYPSASSSSSTNDPTPNVHIRPLSVAFLSRGARIDALSTAPLLTGPDTSDDESAPPTPSPTSSEPHIQYPRLVSMSAYSHPAESPSSVAITPENTLAPIGSPQNPNTVVLPAIAQILPAFFPEVVESERSEGVVESEVSEEAVESELAEDVAGVEVVEAEPSEIAAESEMSEDVDESEVSEVLAERGVLDIFEGGMLGALNIDWRFGAVHANPALEVGDESEASEGGNEGDDEDESDNEDEYYEYISAEEDESVDIEYLQLATAQAFGSQHSALGYSEPSASPVSLVVVDNHPETEGSAHADDGHLRYSTDDDLE